MRIIHLTKETKNNLLQDLLKRSPNNYGQYESIVADIIEQVKTRKDDAVKEYTKKFDKWDITADLGIKRDKDFLEGHVMGGSFVKINAGID